MGKFIIVGLTPQGLSIVRMLARAGHEVTAFTNTKNAVGYYSRYGKKLLFSTVQELKAGVCSIVAGSNEKVRCVVTSGELLTLLIDEFPEIYELCDVESGPLKLLRVLSKKNKMYAFAQMRELTCAKWRVLSDYQHGDLAFPVIMKRNVEVPLFFKVKILQSKQELDSFITQITPLDRKFILLQEYMSSASQLEISYQAYFRNGEACAEFVAKQIRRLQKGLTSYLEEVVDKPLHLLAARLSRKLLSGTGYSGFAEVEYIFNADAGALQFIEINTRPCGLHSALRQKYPNLSVVYDVSAAECAEHLQASSKPIKWINLARDLKVRYEKKDFTGLGILFKSGYDILDWRDLKPFIMQFVNRCR